MFSLKILQRQFLQPSSRSISTQTKYRQIRSDLFNEEHWKQKNEIKNVEKINVEYVGQQIHYTHEDMHEMKPINLVMNKNFSTSSDCARHIDKELVDRTMLAIVDGEIVDMNQPLMKNCQLDFLYNHSIIENYEEKRSSFRKLNEAYWRTCSFLIGYIMEKSFQSNYSIELCGFSSPKIFLGSFFYDMKIMKGNKNIVWQPTKEELRSLSMELTKLKQKNLLFEHLSAPIELVRKMFKNNSMKLKQIEKMEEKSSLINLYRIDDFVDISSGPFITSPNHIGSFDITALHDISSETYGNLKRVQGVSIPFDLKLHVWTYEQLKERSKNLNTAATLELSSDEQKERKKTIV
ncbi:hypothetical protein SNEBB_001273 [Seison nebaliae]|nr:hypothetical protein SNEBB_001273 [Seison nebaliae]